MHLPPIITPEFIGPRFPTFYAEMAYMDGYRDGSDPASNCAAAYVRWDEFCPVARPWFIAGSLGGRAA